MNGEIEIIATVIEQGTAPSTGTGTGTGGTGTGGTGTGGTGTGTGTSTGTGSRSAGTPVQNGTLVSFTTTLGRIEPREARTQNGEVRVKFIAGGESGEAKITAYSGGASATLEKILVGAAAAERITVAANPQSVSFSGGQAQILARLQTSSGTGIAGVPVAFSTTAGTLSTTFAVTDATGLATTTLTTDREAKVTAAAGGKTSDVTVAVGARLIENFTASPQATSAGTPVTFTFTAGSTANIREAVIDFGDGSPAQSLGSGSSTLSHVYDAPGQYTATVTARDSLGGSQTRTTTVTIGGLPVTLSASPSTPTPGQQVTFTAAGIGSAQVARYQWTFDDGRSYSTSGPQTTASFDTRGQKVVRVDVIGVNGGILGSAETRLTVQGG